MQSNRPTGGSGTARDEVLSFVATGNADPILREILHALAGLLETGAEATIDLGAIPFAAGDERVFDAVLGKGEVHAVIDVMGKSHVTETGIPGVWRVDHFDEKGETTARFIEVTFMPQILKTQREDAALGYETLKARLGEREGERKN